MNREIKFRGRVIESGGRWAYGSLITNSAGTSYIVNSNIAPSKMGDRYEEVVNVGQYTGLKDCTGKEIYEGDIITVNGKYPKLVKYIDDWASYCLANISDLDSDGETRYWQQVSPCWWTDFEREIKVIGNQFDNPRLLKTEDNKR